MITGSGMYARRFVVPLLLALAASCASNEGPQPLPTVTIHTSKGNVLLELFEDDAPNSVANFIMLTEKKFYDGLSFHRVEPDFVIQGGCPKGNGSGGPGYCINTEISKRKHQRGVLAMARETRRNTEGSQFYITLRRCPELDGGYTVFGRVLDGMDVVDRIAIGDKIVKIVVNGKRSHPYVPKMHP